MSASLRRCDPVARSSSWIGHLSHRRDEFKAHTIRCILLISLYLMFLGREFLLSGELCTLTSAKRMGQRPREVQFFQALFLRISKHADMVELVDTADLESVA